jgi:hypothetical protein
MNHKTIKYTALLIASFSTTFAFAQNAQTQKESTVNQTVTVVREYNPTVSDALKMESMPTLDDTTSYHPVFNYSILSRAFETNNDIEQISPARMAADEQPLLTNSLARLGIGGYNSVYAELNYNITQSKLYALGLSLSHTSSMGNVVLEDDSRVDAPFHDTYASIGFKRFFSKVTLSAGMNFKHNLYNYYGYQTLNALTPYQLNNGTVLVTGDDLLVDKSQRISQFDMGLGVSGNNTDVTKARWNTWLNFSTFGNKTGVTQNKIDITGSTIVPINDLNFILDGQISSYKVNVPDSIGPMYTFSEKQISLISLLPRVGIKFNSGNAELGMLISNEMGRDSKEFRVAPHLTANLTVVEGIVSLFGGLTGHLNMNDDASMFAENPYLSSDVHVKSSFHGMNLFGGIKGNFSSSTSFSARVDYSAFNDEHFFVNRLYLQSPVITDSVYSYSNLFDVVYDSGTLLEVSGELITKPSDDLSLRLFAKYNGWNLNDLAYAWQKPETEASFSGTYQVNRNLSVDAAINLLGKRYAYIPNSEAKKMDSMVDINLGGTYKFSSGWSFWGRINNLAAAKYERWNGYPTQRFNGMVGATYSF